MFWELGNKRSIADSLREFASLAVREGREERSARLCGAALVLREVLGRPLAPCPHEEWERDFARLEAALGQPAFAVALEAGRAFTLEAAIEYALEEDICL